MPCSNEPTPASECQSFNMASVFDRIDHQLGKYKRHKLWKTFFLGGKGPTVALSTLKAYAPAISYFIMGFRDFNEFVLPYETSQNAPQIAINEHAKEDYTHYKLIIEDWEKHGGDKLVSVYDTLIPCLSLEDHQACITETFATMRSESTLSCSTKMLSFLWSDATNRHNRQLLHNCTRLVHTCGEDPVVCFAMIETGRKWTCRVFCDACISS
ncbi:unnamed protein product [Rotaria magnacalcarata]|uniref:Uncharacterized protein n=1 Tax=Rotaria magnacalcarata TaxID=392030 RepID=A0A816LGM2_9BILA|nr:unnamed protein product [Rotaria magnacalcarata]CAF1674744.1 unnamed protein product [Rotaria magnacalcarata]CAF1932628.1 unnamed protein product [Rotaria magnacalcarata]CAF2083557.1 unnamed protein product [Rotaria magnacalcarata]CAF4220012.1 unnamed protein product [Rotaria magnacalcarata]